jgi:NitT/TauT family transport system substrate-binding protein
MKKAKAHRLRPLLLPLVVLLLASGCGRGRDSSSDPESGTSTSEAQKIKIGYLGLTCEPAIFAAYEEGFFKEEGLDVELVKTDWPAMGDGLSTGRFHATYSFIMYLMKPIEMGKDLKLTGGIHTGCLRVQAGTTTAIKDVADLKGKKVGITHLGSPPFLFASRVLADKGMDPKKDVEWVTLRPDSFSAALDQGEVDAIASAEPLGAMLLADNKVHHVCDQARDAPYADEYCCVVAVNGKFARDNPSAAAKVTRALLKGARWVGINPMAAAKLAFDKKYVAVSLAVNAQALALLKFEPGVARAKRDIRTAALVMKKSGFLKKNTDPEELASSAWLDLEGVSDDWLKGVKVQRVEGGGRPPRLNPSEFAALFNRELGCRGEARLGCCADAGEALLPMTEEWALVRPIRLDLAGNRPGALPLSGVR